MDYVEAAMRTQASQSKIRERVYHLGDKATQLDNAARGMAGDVGEVNTCIQNWLEYGKSLDEVNLKEELGDVLWRIAQMCHAMRWSLQEVQDANIAKLRKRYPEKYSDEQADPDKRDKLAEREAVATPSSRELDRGFEEGQSILQQTGQGWAEPPVIYEEPQRIEDTWLKREQLTDSVHRKGLKHWKCVGLDQGTNWIRSDGAKFGVPSSYTAIIAICDELRSFDRIMPIGVRDGWAVAREIVGSYLDGKNADVALRSIESAEAKYKGGK